MDNNILYSLFVNNPDLDKEISRFCRSLPEYNRAQKEYFQAAQEVLSLLGAETYCPYEERLNRYWSLINDAHYLFGLNLRRDILQALGPSL